MKLVLAFVWVGACLALTVGQGVVATAGIVVVCSMILIHLVEFAAKRHVMTQAGGSMSRHLLLTIVFGLVHWVPLERSQKREAESTAR